MELTAAEAWARVLERARALLPEQTFRLWLEQTEPVALSQDHLTVAAGSEFAADWIEDHYGELLGEVAERILGERVSIVFRHDPEADETRASAAGAPAELSHRPGADGSGQDALSRERASHNEAGRAGSSPAAPGSGNQAAAPNAGQSGTAAGTPGERPDAAAQSAAGDGTRRTPNVAFGSPLNERYSFERFVVGSNNQMANAACRAVSEAPARMYNPLFIYGGVGLGKTHLMHAIGHALLARHTDRRVAYISSERFTNDLIASIQEGRMSDFRRRYREIDLLLIDDVQFLGEKERTQEEFFHTFNALHESKRQIVMTSDRPPKEIPGLEERLVSRFEWGLVTDIKPPDLETRVAILRKKAEDDAIELGDDVLDFIARNCRSNVRELEGAVIKLLAYASLTRRAITPDLTQEALGGVLGAPERTVELTPKLIRDRVAAAWGVTVDGLASKKRTKELTVPRQVAMYLIRELLDVSLVEIGNLFGGRDHSTVIHSINKVEEELLSDETFRTRVNGLRSELT